MHRIDLEAANLARSQLGVFVEWQVLPYGSRRQIQHRVRTGHWVHLGRRVYALPSTALTPKTMYKAAELSLPRAAVSGLAAGVLQSLRNGPFPEPEISVRPPGTHDHPFATVRRRHDIRTHRVDGIRTTTVAQTIADLTGRLDVREVGRMLEVSILEGRTSMASLENRQRAMQKHHLPYRRVFRDVLDDRRDTMAVATSMLEVRLLEVLAGLPIPPWNTQFKLDWWNDGDARADVAIPQWKMIIEADGRRWHGRLDDFERDRRRDQLAAAQGWIVLRFTWVELVHDPAFVAATILAAGGHRLAA